MSPASDHICPSLPLTAWPVGQPGYVAVVAWDAMSIEEGRRLRELGILEGVTITKRHEPTRWWGGPMAITVDRMMVALRPNLAAHILVMA